MFHIQKDKKFTPERARFYAAELVCGLQYLHREGIIYRFVAHLPWLPRYWNKLIEQKLPLRP